MEKNIQYGFFHGEITEVTMQNRGTVPSGKLT